MSKIVMIDSSNIYRPWDSLKDEVKSGYNLQRCTKIECFTVVMTELVNEDSKVIISVIENFVCDAVLSTEKKEVEDNVSKTLDAFVAIVKTTATRLPNTRYTQLSVPPVNILGMNQYHCIT